MQKLMPFLKDPDNGTPRSKSPEQGSALVGAVAFSILLFIASLGYLQVVASSRNYEAAGFWDDRALTAAESGLNLGAQWLSQQEPSNDPAHPFSRIDNPSNIYSENFGGIQVGVSVVIAPTGDTAEIRSTATTTMLTYKKTLSWKMTMRQPGWYGTFLNKFVGNWWQGQGNTGNIRFDGPSHFNTIIDLSSVSSGQNSVRFLDRVTVHHSLAPHDANFNYGDGAHDNNNYDWGVYKHGGVNSAVLDAIFTRQYRHHQDSLVLPPVTGQTILLPAGDAIPANSDPTVPLQRPFLRFNGNQATYYYWQGGVVRTQLINNLVNQIIRVPNDLYVSGTMSGSVTVVTNTGFNLIPVGNILYSGYNPIPYNNDFLIYNGANNYGILPLTNPNILALVSGKDITFTDQWIDPSSGSVNPIAVTSALIDSRLCITAMMIASEAGSSLRFVHQHHQLPKPGDYTNISGIRIIGSRTMDMWEQFGPGLAGGTFFSFHFDERQGEGLLAPGIQGYRRFIDNGIEGLVLSAGTWSETNYK